MVLSTIYGIGIFMYGIPPLKRFNYFCKLFPLLLSIYFMNFGKGFFFRGARGGMFFFAIKGCGLI